jgi:hypothetical protein
MKMTLNIDVDLAVKLYMLLTKSDPAQVHEVQRAANLREQIDEQVRMIEAKADKPATQPGKV